MHDILIISVNSTKTKIIGHCNQPHTLWRGLLGHDSDFNWSAWRYIFVNLHSIKSETKLSKGGIFCKVIRDVIDIILRTCRYITIKNIGGYVYEIQQYTWIDIIGVAQDMLYYTFRWLSDFLLSDTRWCYAIWPTISPEITQHTTRPFIRWHPPLALSFMLQTSVFQNTISSNQLQFHNILSWACCVACFSQPEQNQVESISAGLEETRACNFVDCCWKSWTLSTTIVLKA